MAAQTRTPVRPKEGLCELCGAAGVRLVQHHDHACELAGLARALEIGTDLQMIVTRFADIRRPRNWCQRCNSLEARMKISIQEGKGEAFSYFTFRDDDVRACLEIRSQQDLQSAAEQAYRKSSPVLLFAATIVRRAAQASLDARRPLEKDEIARLVPEVFHQVGPVGKQPRVPWTSDPSRPLNSLEELVVHASIASEERRFITVPCNCCGRKFLEICRFHHSSCGTDFPIKGQMHLIKNGDSTRGLCAQCEGSTVSLADAHNKAHHGAGVEALRAADIKPWLIRKSPDADVSEAVQVAAAVVALCGEVILLPKLPGTHIILKARPVGENKVTA